jgi:hypothetical protein
VTFHEEATFHRSKELPCDTEQQEAPSPEPLDTPLSDEQREDSIELSVDPSRDSIDFPLEKPLVKRKLAWCPKILKEVENHATPKGTFRERKRLDKYSGLIAQLYLVIDSKPSTFEEASKHKVWKDIMIEEYDSILKNDVWEVVPIPHGKSVVTSKWFYKIKHAKDNNVEKFKARFVVRGFPQKEGIDYGDIFTHVSRYTCIKIIISLIAVFGWKLHQMDVKTDFLNGEVEQEVYIEQPKGLLSHGK